MRLFHAQMLDEHLEGDGALAQTSGPWAYLLTRAETLKVTCVLDQVVGSPALTLALVGSLANTNFAEMTKTLLNAVPVPAGTSMLTAHFSPQDASYPPPRYLVLLAVLSGANTKAHLQLWVCGRGPQLLDQVSPGAESFTAQYAAVKLLEDEDRLPMRKRALRQGASLVTAPETFLASLHWER